MQKLLGLILLTLIHNSYALPTNYTDTVAALDGNVTQYTSNPGYTVSDIIVNELGDTGYLNSSVAYGISYTSGGFVGYVSLGFHLHDLTCGSDGYTADYSACAPPSPPPVVCNEGDVTTIMLTEGEYDSYSQGADVDNFGCSAYISGNPEAFIDESTGAVSVIVDVIDTGETSTGDGSEASPTPPEDQPPVAARSENTYPDTSNTTSTTSGTGSISNGDGSTTETTTTTKTTSTPGGGEVSGNGTTTVTSSISPDGKQVVTTTEVETVVNPDGSKTVTETITKTTTESEETISTFNPDGVYNKEVKPGSTAQDGKKTTSENFDPNGKSTGKTEESEGEDPEKPEPPKPPSLNSSPEPTATLEASMQKLMSGVYDSALYTALNEVSFPSSGGTCPPFTVNLSLFNYSATTDYHCQIFDSIAWVLSVVTLAGWSIVGLKIIMSA